MFNNAIAVDFDEKNVDAVFASLNQCQLPGAAVGIAIDGKPVYRKGFGLASMELPIVLSPTIRMRIFSTTKHFTCLAYLLLCEEGKAGIDDPVGKHLPELHPVAHKVTMRQLMGNISGLRDACDIRWQFSGMQRSISPAELLSFYCDIDDVNFEPGTAFCYNNGGFVLLSVAIERIAGQPLEEVLRTGILQPVGMHDTLLRRFDMDFVPNSATMHVTSSAGGFDRSYLAGALTGEGGLVSTVDDMLRWLAHMDEPTVGSVATWRAMKAPQILANGTSTGYGLGLVSGRYRGVGTLFHGGGGQGGNSQMLKVPAAGLDIAIMVNRHDVSSMLLANKILDACLPNLDPIKEAPSRPAVTGIFRSPRTGRVIQLCTSSPYSWSTGAQQIASIDGMDKGVEPDNDGVLWPAGVASYMKEGLTLMGDPQTPTSIQLSDFGNLDELTAVKPAQNADVSAIAGQYRSEHTGTDATICVAADGPRFSTTGRFGSAVYRLECLAAGIWRARSTNVVPWGGILSFDDGNGAFRFSTYRTRALPFRRVT